MLNLTTLSAWRDRTMWLFFSLLPMVHVDFTIQNWIRFPGITQGWLWLPVLPRYRIPFANILRVCMSTFIQEYGFFYSRILCLILYFLILPCGREKRAHFLPPPGSREPAVFLVWDMLETDPRASCMLQPPWISKSKLCSPVTEHIPLWNRLTSQGPSKARFAIGRLASLDHPHLPA